jgi:hypothetical protein
LASDTSDEGSFHDNPFLKLVIFRIIVDFG